MMAINQKTESGALRVEHLAGGASSHGFAKIGPCNLQKIR